MIRQHEKVSTACFIFICVMALVGHAEERQYHTTNITGGLALAPNSRPGIHFSIEPSMLIHPGAGLGIHADYSWITPTKKIYSEDAGIHFFGIAPVLKGYYEIDSQKRLIGEIDPGLVLALMYTEVDGEVDYEYTTRFGLTYGLGFNYHRILFGFRVKSIFLDVLRKNVVDYGNRANWFCIYIGYAGS